MPYVVKMFPVGDDFISPDFASKGEAQSFLTELAGTLKRNGEFYTAEHGAEKAKKDGLAEGYYSSPYLGRIPVSRIKLSVVWEAALKNSSDED